jgi:Animal haem peroxidase
MSLVGWVAIHASSVPGRAESPAFSVHLKNDMRSHQQAMVDQAAGAFRAIDGSYNNLMHPDWGQTGNPFVRLTYADYGDGQNSPSGSSRPGPREISNTVVAQPRPRPNSRGLTDMFWQWGQFLDHDITLTPFVEPFEYFNIPVPAGDPFFDPLGTGAQSVELTRSGYVLVNGIREQVNINTAFIDASQVYGSDEARARELRTLDGTGRLKTSPGDLLPFNVHGFFNFPVDDDPSFFLAGDVRANEQVGLTSMQTVFLREHNFWADMIHRMMPEATGETVYQLARLMVGSEIQIVTYREFLPLLLGPNALPPYEGYDPTVNPTIANEFAAACYRVGHTLLSPQLQRLKRNGRPTLDGPLPLRSAFFNPEEFMRGGGPDPLLRGLASQLAQEVDVFVVDDVRNFLFGPPGAGGFDLASLNIQRGRDHGLPSYTQVRAHLGLAPRASFSQISSGRLVQDRLAKVYASVDDVDLWVGGLAEDHMPNAMVGETFYAVLRNQFQRLRDGDRFWYQNVLPADMAQMLERQTLAIIIRRNTGLGLELQDDVFLMPTGK